MQEQFLNTFYILWEHHTVTTPVPSSGSHTVRRSSRGEAPKLLCSRLPAEGWRLLYASGLMDRSCRNKFRNASQPELTYGHGSCPRYKKFIVRKVSQHSITQQYNSSNYRQGSHLLSLYINEKIYKVCKKMICSSKSS